MLTILGVPHSLVIRVSNPRVPPEIISEFLGAAIQLPRSEDIEALVIHHENSTWAVAVRGSQRAYQDSVGTAMNRVRGCVSGARGERLRLDHLHDLRVARIGLRIENMNARRVNAGYHQVAAFHMRMWSMRAQAGAACIPSEMMQLVAGIRHLHLAHQIAVAGRRRIDIHDAHRVRTAVVVSIDHRDVCQLFGRCIHRHLGGSVKSWIGSPD